MKRSEQKVTKTINVTPEEAWKIIGAVTGVEKWFAPMITNSRLEGDKRVCSTNDGEFTEDIVKVDHKNKVFEYGIPEQHMMPVENIEGVMRVTGKEQATIEWSWTFDVSEDQETQAREMLAGAGEMGISGIEQLVLGNR